MTRFTINKKTYTAKPFDYNLICDLEELGCSLEKMKTQQTASLRAYFALCAEINTKDAGEELENHMINGGNLKEIVTAFEKELEKSEFLNAIKNSSSEENEE